MASPLCTPKKVPNEASTRASSMATKPNSFWLPPAAAVALEAQAAELQFLERGQQLEGERIVGPVLVDDRLVLRLHVGPHLPDDRQFLVDQDVDELVEVAVRRRELARLAD